MVKMVPVRREAKGSISSCGRSVPTYSLSSPCISTVLWPLWSWCHSNVHSPHFFKQSYKKEVTCHHNYWTTSLCSELDLKQPMLSDVCNFWTFEVCRPQPSPPLNKCKWSTTRFASNTYSMPVMPGIMRSLVIKKTHYKPGQFYV